MTPELPWDDIASAPLVYLSPHSDDAAFSSASLLHACGRRRIPVQIVTCFSRSANSRSAPGSGVAQTSEVRKAEDQSFAATLPGPVSLRWLDLDDAPLRPAHAGKHPCKETTPTADDAALTADIVEVALEAGRMAMTGRRSSATELAAGSPKATWVLAPLGLGRHIDHLVVRDAGAALARHGQVRVAFWEDLPYAGRAEPGALQSEIDATMAALGLHLTPHLALAPDLNLEAIKQQALACYPSQVVEVHRHGVLTQLRRASGTGILAERLWLPG